MGKQSPMVTRHQPGPGGSREEEERSEQREAGTEGMLATLSGHGEGRGVGGGLCLSRAAMQSRCSFNAAQTMNVAISQSVTLSSQERREELGIASPKRTSADKVSICS